MSAVAAVPRRAPLRPTRGRAAALASLATGAVCLLFVEPSPAGAVSAAAVAILVWLAAIDLEFRLIPNRVVLPATGIVLALVLLLEPAAGPERVVAALGAAGFLLLAALARSGGLGMGDVKLALLLGAALGGSVLLALLVGFGAAGLVGVGLVARSGRSALKRQLPLAPFLAFGAVVALLVASTA